MACYTGPSGTEGVGACKGGIATCQANGTYGVCNGEVLPAAENCLGNIDTDCNGTLSACPGAWQYIFGDDANSNTEVNQVALASNGDIVVAGSLLNGSTVTFQGTTYHSTQTNELFVARFDSTGTPMWLRVLPGQVSQVSYGLAIAPDGSIVVAGDTMGSVDFGVGTQMLSTPNAGFVWKLHADGTPSWGVLARGDQTEGDEIRAVAIDVSGNIGVTGLCGGATNTIGSTSLGCDMSHPYFVAKLDPAGALLWSHPYFAAIGTGVGFDTGGDLLLGGGNAPGFDFGGGSMGPAQIFDARFAAANGAYQAEKIWSATTSLSVSYIGQGFAWSPSGESATVARQDNDQTPFDFGGGPVTGYGFVVVGVDSTPAFLFQTPLIQDNFTTTPPHPIVAARPNGGYVVMGIMNGSQTITPMSGPVVSVAGSDTTTYGARIGSTHTLDTSVGFDVPQGGITWPQGVAVDAQDHIFMAGFYGPKGTNLGAGAQPVINGSQGIVARLGW